MKKGFTLIELLAVIIILAVVALISTPIVLDVVNDAKDSAAKSTTYNILDAAKMYYAESMFDNNKKTKLTGVANIYDEIIMNGKKPAAGQLYINKKGLVAIAVIINNKCYKKEFAGELQIIEDDECNVGVAADDINPSVSLSVVGSPFNELGWSNKDFYVNIDVIDHETGGYSYMWCSDTNDCEPMVLKETSGGKVLVSTESESTVVCVIGYDLAGNESEKTCSEPYKLDKQKPTLTVTSEDIEIDQGDDILVSSYFNISYGISDGSLSCIPENTSSLGVGTQTISCTATSGSELTEITSKTITVNEKSLFETDNSGANAPILFNMIPIAYNGTNWIRVDANQRDWYSYDEKAWANAVVLNSGVTKNVGDIINVDTEVSLMYVWIPRYKYTIFNGNNGSAPEQEIKINFESGINSTGTVTCNDSFISTNSSETCSTITNNVSTYTHPAFCLGHRTNGTCDGNELTGIWVGKFEISAPLTQSDTIQKAIIKPNITSWRNAKILNFYTSISNISSDYGISADSHMVKNMEWGAVAYLSHSKYGRCTSGTCSKISLNNSAYLTGAGNYASNVNQSATNNIYGIYDMSGGSNEYVMGNMITGGTFYTGNSGFLSAPATKYYDAYSYNSSSSVHYISRGKLGDATKETLKEKSTTAGGWYGDYSNLVYSSYQWIIRGGRTNTYPGIFTFDQSMYRGGAHVEVSTRAVITSP